MTGAKVIRARRRRDRPSTGLALALSGARTAWLAWWTGAEVSLTVTGSREDVEKTIKHLAYNGLPEPEDKP